MTDLTRSSAQRTSRQTAAGPTVDVDLALFITVRAAKGGGCNCTALPII